MKLMNKRRVKRWLRAAQLVAALGLAASAHASPPPGHSPRAVPEEIILRGIDSEGNELALRVPVNILLAPAGSGLAQLQQPGNNANINLNQIGGTSVSGSLYDSGNIALKVNCIVGCSAAGSFTDNSAFTTGSTSVTNVSGLFNDTATNLTSGNAGAIRATTDRMLFVNIGKIGGTAPTLTGSSLNVNCTGGCSSSAGFTDNSAFTAGTATETNGGGVFNDGLTALSSGNAAAARITPNRGVHVNLRNNSGTEIATSANPLRIDPTGTTTQPVSGTVTANAGTGQFNVTCTAANCPMNVAQVGGTNTVTGGVAGLIAVGGNVANAGTATANPVPVGGVFTTAPTTLTTGQTATAQFTAAQNLKEDISTIAGTAPTTAGKLDVKGADGDVFVRQATAASLNATVVGTKTNNNAAPGATNFGVLPCSANAAAPSWTEGNLVNCSVDLSGRERIVGIAGDNGVAATTDRVPILPAIAESNMPAAATAGRNTAMRTDLQGNALAALVPVTSLTTYSASTTTTAAASPTDLSGLPGNATNTVVVTRAELSCTETTAGIITATLLTRGTADTAGTSSNTTIAKMDRNNGAAVSVPLTYTVNPTVNDGSPTKIREWQIGALAAATATANDIAIYSSTGSMGQGIVLRGTAQVLYWNFSGTAHAGLSCSTTFQWIETTGL